ncbi:hypothetical protein BOC59_09485 [Burkholderia pseudomallei]|nr:DNA-binding domain-containing protein [Burkholderia pseudomallei]ARM00254.1 hypothetical protein BOC59_09485 [Burkholderia pseudomallei]
MTTVRLEWIQRSFASALDDPEDEHFMHGCVKPVRTGTDHGSTVRRRIGLYRGNVRANWRAALASAYPVLLALVGDAYFDALSIAYARAYPS